LLIRAAVILSFLLCAPFIHRSLAAAQSNNNNANNNPQPATVNSAQRLMIRQNYSAAKEQVNAILANDPNDIHALYTLAVIEQSRILDYESYAMEGKSFMLLADSLITVLEARMPRLKGADSVQALFYCANLTGGKGIMQAKRGDWLDGARSAMASVGMLKNVKKLDPGHLGADLGIGVFDYYLGGMFKWVPFATGASVERGLEAIKRALDAPFPFDQAAKNTYCWILIDRKQFAAADSIAHAELVRLPGNSLFLRIRAITALWTGCYEDALLLAGKLTAAARGRAPVNWSDLVSGYYITVSAYDNLGRKAEAYAAACKILDTPIPAAYKNVPHVKDHLKYISGVRSKYKPEGGK